MKIKLLLLSLVIIFFIYIEEILNIIFLPPYLIYANSIHHILEFFNADKDIRSSAIWGVVFLFYYFIFRLIEFILDMISIWYDDKNIKYIILFLRILFLKSFGKNLTKEIVVDFIEESKAKNKKVDLNGVNLIGVDLIRVDLTNANLTGANLRNAYLKKADLTNARLYGANLIEAILYNANLTGAKLIGADLTNARLFEAKLIGADLRYADLRNADLRYADLRNADLKGAQLEGAYLEGANLEGAIQ
jgi:hypothetical protein